MLREQESIHVMNELCTNARLKHQEEINLIIEEAEFKLFSMLKPELYKDGNAWCCLYGENIVEGIVGFGDTPRLAVYEWNKAWNEKITVMSGS